MKDKTYWYNVDVTFENGGRLTGNKIFNCSDYRVENNYICLIGRFEKTYIPWSSVCEISVRQEVSDNDT